MTNHLMGEFHPAFLGHQGHQVELNLYRVLLAREPQTLGNPAYVGVHHQTRDVEGVAQDDVGRLAADPRQFYQFIQGSRYLAAEFLHQGLANSLEALGFLMVKTGGIDGLLQVREVGSRVVGRSGVLAEYGRGDLVNPDIGALGREHRSDQ